MADQINVYLERTAKGYLEPLKEGLSFLYMSSRVKWGRYNFPTENPT